MDNEEATKKIREAAEEGKIEFADQSGIESFPEEFVDAFLLDILGVRGAWISDESSLSDFRAGSGDSLDPLYAKIKEKYRVDVSGKDNLLDIFRAIHAVNTTVQ